MNPKAGFCCSRGIIRAPLTHETLQIYVFSTDDQTTDDRRRFFSEPQGGGLELTTVKHDGSRYRYICSHLICFSFEQGGICNKEHRIVKGQARDLAI